MFKQLIKQKVNIKKAKYKKKLVIKRNSNYKSYKKEENDLVTNNKLLKDNTPKMLKKLIKLAKETKKALIILLKLVFRKILI